MGKNVKWKDIGWDLLWLTVIVSVVTLVAYAVNGIYPFGDASIARGDMVQQTIPAGMYYVWDILHGQASPFFTWESAYGMNIAGASSLGALLSPLNLFLYFTTRDNIVYFANILMILKMISIGGAMYFYLRKYDVNRMVHVIGGVLYAFGAASLIHFQIIMVMDVAFLLPLIMIGVDRIFAGKGCKFFVLVLTLTMMVNVYTGSITLVFVFMSCALQNFWEVTDTKERKRCALQLGISAVMALLLSAAITIPALQCISSTSRTSLTIKDTYKIAIESQWRDYEWETVKRMLVNVALPFSCIVCFVFSGLRSVPADIKRHRRHLCMLVLLVLSVAVAGIELLWHGGSRASWPVRFVYVISFALVDFAVTLYQEKKERFEKADWNVKKPLLAGIAAVITVLSGVIFVKIYEAFCQSAKYAPLGDDYLCILLEVMFLVIYICLWKFRAKAVLPVVLCVELTCTSVMSFAPNKDNWTVFSAEYLEAANAAAKSMTTEIQDFERMKNTDYRVDHIEYSLVMGQEAISNYWHVIHPSLQPNFDALGYTINWTQLLDTGGTIFTDTLFQTKYFMGQKEMPEELYEFCEDLNYNEEETLQLYKNKFSLPFAIGTDTESLTATGELFSTQNALFQTITGSDATLIADMSAQLPGSHMIVPVGQEKKLLYFYGTNASTLRIQVNGETVTFPSSSTPLHEEYPVDFCNGLVFLGCFQNEQVEIKLEGDGTANLADIHLGALDYDTFVAGIQQVESQNPDIAKLEQRNAGLKLELKNVTKSHVFLPVSYEEGWKCSVNGEEVELGNIMGMVSVPVEQGDNTIVMKYVAPGQRTGTMISLVALVIFVAFWLLTKKGILSTEKVEGYVGIVAYVVFIAVSVAYAVILYVIPIVYALKRVLFTVE